MKPTEAWVTVVLAGIVLSIAAVYIVRWLDRGTGAIVAWLAELGQRRQTERAARVAAARSNRDLLHLFKIRTVSLRLRGVALLILALAFGAIGAFFRYVANDPLAFQIGCVSGAITGLVALVLLCRAISAEAEMRDAEKPGS